MSALRWISREPPTAEVVREFRLCLDLNVWVAAILSRMAQRKDTAVQVLTEAAIDGTCPLGPTRLVVSWSMLARLEKVLVQNLGIEPDDARIHVGRIARAAMAEPVGGGPYVILGGSGVVPLHDDEDARVMEAALAGRADLVVTANLQHFANYRSEILKEGRILVHRTAGHELLIAHPAEVVRWVRTGIVTLG